MEDTHTGYPDDHHGKPEQTNVVHRHVASGGVPGARGPEDDHAPMTTAARPTTMTNQLRRWKIDP